MRTLTWCENPEAPLPIVSMRFWCLLQTTHFFWYVCYFLEQFHENAVIYLLSMSLLCTKLNHVNILCLSFPMWDKAPSHIISDLRPWLKPLGWRTVDPGFVSRYKTVACFLQWAARADICTLPRLSRIYCTQGLSTSTPTWSCGAGWSDSLDRWMDVHEKMYFFHLFPKKYFLVRTGPSWTCISFLWTHFFPLSDAIRTALSHKKVNLKEKKSFACFHCVDRLYKEMVSPNLSNERACPQLSVETHPHACNNESKGQHKSKQGRSKPWHQAQNREHPRTITRAISCTFNHPKSRRQLEQSVVNRRCGTVIWFP